MSDAVEVESLTLRYGSVTALHEVSLRVPRGELYVLAGADGAGKSSLLRVVSSLLSPTSGTVRLEGHVGAARDPELRRRLGYLPQGFTMYEDLSIEENLRFFGDLYEVDRARMGERVEELLDWSGLGRFRARLAGHLSGGMKQKLSLAVLLLHDPALLLLDEPTTGIDVPTRRDFWDYLLTLKVRGMTIVVATPYLEEARKADRVGFLHQGRLVTEATPAALLASLPGEMWELAAADADQARERMRASGRFPLVTWRARRVRFMAPPGASDVAALLAEAGVSGELTRSSSPSFEDAFLHLARQAGPVTA